MAILTLTKGMDQTVKIELGDENGQIEVVAGAMTTSDFRIVDMPSSAVNVLKLTGSPGTHSIFGGVVSVPVLASDLTAVSAGSYFGQWSGTVNSKALVTELFEITIEPKVGV